MAKQKTYYRCSKCGYKTAQDMGRCPYCREFHTFELVSDADESSPSAGMKVAAKAKHAPSSKAYSVSELGSGSTPRTSTGIPEFDRLLNGGFVRGQVVLIGAEPGFGKSTLALEVASKLSVAGWPCLYASGEESEQQIGERARRLGLPSSGGGDRNLRITSTTVIEDVLGLAQELDARLVVVDSLQTMATETVDGQMGGISQSKEAAYAFKEYAKSTGCVFLLISQFNKDNEVAGSNQIPHVVDTILVGESQDETRLKFLRARKNRYGQSDEVAVFVHEDDGLKSVTDPSEYLLGDASERIAGAARTLVQNGARLLPAEVDALVTSNAYGTPQRSFNGVDWNRAKIVIACLGKYAPVCGVSSSDVFLSTVSGVRVQDPNADLAMAAALVSSATGMVEPTRTAWFGEITLTGLVRGRALIAQKAREAARLGFRTVVVPKAALGDVPDGLGVSVVGIDKVSDIEGVYAGRPRLVD